MINVNPDPRDTVATVRRLLTPALPACVEAFVYGSMARAATSPTRPDVPPMDIDVCILDNTKQVDATARADAAIPVSA